MDDCVVCEMIDGVNEGDGMLPKEVSFDWKLDEVSVI
jgi:hypothetical protein